MLHESKTCPKPEHLPRTSACQGQKDTLVTRYIGILRHGNARLGKTVYLCTRVPGNEETAAATTHERLLRGEKNRKTS